MLLTFDWRIAAFSAALTLTTAALFGLAPAWQGAHVPLAETMQRGGRTLASNGGRIGVMRSALVVGAH